MNSKQNQDDKLSSAKDCALRYLSYRARSVMEVRGKLAEKGFNTDVINAVIAFLKEYKFVDDNAFARMWIRNRTTLKPAGRRRIINELFQKGIDKDTINCNLSELLPEQEEQMAADLVERKLRRAAFSYKKLEGFLARRGFDPGIIRKVLTGFNKEDNS